MSWDDSESYYCARSMGYVYSFVSQCFASKAKLHLWWSVGCHPLARLSRPGSALYQGQEFTRERSRGAENSRTRLNLNPMYVSSLKRNLVVHGSLRVQVICNELNPLSRTWRIPYYVKARSPDSITVGCRDAREIPQQMRMSGT